jgi:hypothetical protein
VTTQATGKHLGNGIAQAVLGGFVAETTPNAPSRRGTDG